MSEILAWWVLPALVTFLFCAWVKRMTDEPPESWDAGMWFSIVTLSVLWPVFWLIWGVSVLSQATGGLLKERKWGKR